MPTPQDYEEALRLAVEALQNRDRETVCFKTGASLYAASGAEQRASISFLERPYTLLFSKNDIAFEASDAPLSVPDQVLLLHYLADATGAPLEDRWITFREVPSGGFYYASFLKRAVVPLVKTFGQRPAALEAVSGTLGRLIDSPGDLALRIDALPRVPVVLSIWEGDEEFPAEGNVYFDASVSSYLGTEDIAYVAGATVYRVLTIAKDLV